MENNDGTKPTDDSINTQLKSNLTYEQLAKFTKTVQDANAMQSDMRTSIQEALMGYIGGKGEPEPMRALIVGGVFTPMDKQPTKTSSSTIVDTLHEKLRDLYHYRCDSMPNGTLEALKSATTNYSAPTPFSVPHSDLIIWMPVVDNDENTVYPKKKQGATLIVSKVMRPEVTDTDLNNNEVIITPATTTMDAISRIFKFHANAVITIDTSVPKQYTFTLIDALGNQWGKPTTDLTELTDNIHRFHEWNHHSVRRSITMPRDTNPVEIDTLIEVTKQLSQECTKVQGRYFGNCSTRCQSLSYLILVSKRNINKTFLTADDLVPVMLNVLGHTICFDNDKPSVDTPIQVRLYDIFPRHNFYIHGHAYVEDAPSTKEYYPCGDVREVESIHKLIMTHPKLDADAGVMNLRNHGFFLYADSLTNLQLLANSIKFTAKPLNEAIDLDAINNSLPKTDELVVKEVSVSMSDWDRVTKDANIKTQDPYIRPSKDKP
jgi:hypothetical protein